MIVKTERQDGPPDHSYSVKDKPRMPHRERQAREKIQLPYPLEKDHAYVRGEPQQKEIIVSVRCSRQQTTVKPCGVLGSPGLS